MQTLTRPLTATAEAVKRRSKHFYLKRDYARAFEARGYDRIARQLMDCSETQLLACCSNCGHHWWVPNRCRLRVCPLCSYRIAKERARFLIAMTRHMIHPKMLTLTQPLWKRNPHEGIKLLRENFNKLRRTKLFEKVIGGAYLIEVVLKDEGYHIHMHVMLDVEFIPYQKIFTAWKTILNFEHPSIDIRSASSNQARTYLAKDASKSACRRTTPDQIVDWYEATKGERLFATFGKWYNAKIEELEENTLGIDTAPPCPSCGSVDSTFMARDGPFIYGHDVWKILWKKFQDDCDVIRPWEVVKEALELPGDETGANYLRSKTEWKCTQYTQEMIKA